jgi:hypothetical protein
VSPFVSALVAIAALRGTLDASTRTEVRARNSYDGAATFDLETGLDVMAMGRSRRWELKLGYTPRLTLRGDVGPAPDFMHGVVLGARYTGRRASISLFEEASYGRQTWTPFIAAEPTLGPGAAGLGALPLPVVIDYAFSRTGLSAKLAPTRRWGLGLSLECALSGGADTSSRASLPFQSGPRGALSAEYALARTDHLTSAFGASWTGFSTGPEDIIVQATESWRHALGRHTESTLAGGVAWTTSRTGASAPFRSLAHPIAEATITHGIPSLRLHLHATSRISPVIDPVIGRVDERVDTNGGGAWRVTRRVSILGYAGAAQSVSWATPGAITMLYHGITVMYRASKIVQIDGGTRGFWWRTRGEDAPPPQWIVFAGLTLTAPQVRF